MAIIIPSKNIYDLKNDKVERNIFNKAEISLKSIQQVSQKDSSVYSHTTGTAERTAHGTNETFDTKIYNHAPIYAHFVATSTALDYRYSTYTFDVPAFTENLWIKQVHGGTADATVLCTLEEGTYTRTAATVISQSLETLNNDGQTFYAQSTTERSYLVGLPQKTLTDTYSNISMPKALSYSSTASIAPTDGSETLLVNAALTLPDPFATVNVLSSDSEKFTVQCKVLTRLIVYKGNHSSTSVKTWQADSGATASSTDYKYTLSGTYESYFPTSVEVHVYGNSLNISIQDSTVTIGAENGTNVFTLHTSNELAQTENYYGAPGNSLTQALYENTLNQYANGKETATVICDISAYFNDDGTLAKSATDSSVPMLFNLYDKVIPMVFTADGKDYPMSLYKDRSPKVFEIHGIERYFDGAVWQKIYLQEI